MKNAEKYNDELLKHVCGANPTPFAIVEKTGEFTSCSKIKCSTCKFCGGTNDCHDKKNSMVKSGIYRTSCDI